MTNIKTIPRWSANYFFEKDVLYIDHGNGYVDFFNLEEESPKIIQLSLAFGTFDDSDNSYLKGIFQ